MSANYQEISLDQIDNLKARNAKMSKGEYKTKSLRNRPDPNSARIAKPRWIKAKLPKAKDIARISEIKQVLRQHNLHSVCEEASCPNLAECFGHGTATFMIMGEICTRKCPFCDVTHGRPRPLDKAEPANLAKTVKAMKLDYVVITSVDRDDLRDGGAEHFVNTVNQLRKASPQTKIEILTPDFRGRMSVALETLQDSPIDVFNHNLETIPRLYADARPAASYQGSLDLLQNFKQQNPQVATKSGLMVGLGETYDEMLEVLQDLRNHQVEMLTVGQYLQPSRFHLAVERYWTPEEFQQLEQDAYSLGFKQAACGPMVRSSYHADLQAQGNFNAS